MPEGSLGQLIAIHARPEQFQLGNEAFVRTMIYSLPNEVRSQFFPNVPSIDDEEKQILEKNSSFLRVAAIHFLVSYLATEERVRPEIRGLVNQHKARLFWAALSATVPPAGVEDPVRAYGWDRARDAETIKCFQAAYADSTSSFHRIGFVRANPELRTHYLENNPKEWYQRLIGYITSDQYKQMLRHQVILGAGDISGVLGEFYTKLELLRQWAKEDDLQPSAQEVIIDLCQVVLLPHADIIESPFGHIPALIERIGIEFPADDNLLNLQVVAFFHGYAKDSGLLK